MSYEQWYPPKFCKKCNKKCFDQSELETHEAKIHQIRHVFRCKKCHAAVNGTDAFDWHLTNVHGTTHWQLNLEMKKLKKIMREISYD